MRKIIVNIPAPWEPVEENKKKEQSKRSGKRKQISTPEQKEKTETNE